MQRSEGRLVTAPIQESGSAFWSDVDVQPRQVCWRHAGGAPAQTALLWGVAGVRFPQLTLLVRYLAFTHSMLRAQTEPKGGSGRAPGSTEDREAQELLDRLLGSDRDPPPLPPDQASHPSQARSQPWPVMPTCVEGSCQFRRVYRCSAAGLTM